MVARLTLFCVIGLTGVLALSCQEQEPEAQAFDIGLLPGKWNAYETREGQTFVPNITNSLTIAYESGLSFSADGTFRVRRHNMWDGTWSEALTGSNGTYDLVDNMLTLTFDAGTPDATNIYIELIKLDEAHLWIKHSHFGVEVEHHLERTLN